MEQGGAQNPSSPRERYNVVGPAVRRLRYNQKLTQDLLAARCAVAGCDISRSTLAKIEAQIRGVSDVELFVLASVLRVQIEELFPRGYKQALKAANRG